MSARGPRSFRYGPRLIVTVPLALVFAGFAATMAFLATHSGTVMSVVDAVASAIGAAFAVGMGLAAIARVRGKRRIVLGKHEITAPMDVYSSPPWSALCAEVSKLKIALREGTVVALAPAAPTPHLTR